MSALSHPAGLFLIAAVEYAGLWSPRFLDSMSKAQGYIVRLVRNVELALQDGALRGQRAMMAKIVSRLSPTEGIHGALEHLYAVRGYDRFALRLMWLLEHAAERSERLESPATEYDVENLL